MTRDPRPLRERLAAPHPRVICAWCKRTITEGPIPASHGICPDCARRVEEDTRPTVRKATLWGEILDTHATETELNGFRESQGRML